MPIVRDMRITTPATLVIALALTWMLAACDPGGVPAPTATVPPNPIHTGTTMPDPVPEQNVVLSLPEDMYRHDGAPTEWWWHIGTLRAGDREFGFEINAASFTGQDFAMTQIMLSDIQTQTHYQHTQVYGPAPIGTFDVATWAEGDPSKDWYARLGDPAWAVGGFVVTAAGSGYTKAPSVTIEGDGSGASAVAVLDKTGGVGEIILLQPGSGYTTTPTVTLSGGGGAGATASAVRNAIAMAAPQADPTQNIHVTAVLTDETTLDEVEFDLTMSQQGRPFYVWGTGVEPNATVESLEKDNYYYSFTRLEASGTITVDGTSYPVTGTTWMDHEYGYFGGGTPKTRVSWLLQDMQLDNGYTISNTGITGSDYEPEIGTTVPGYATLQDADGNLYYVESSVTPIGALWTSPVTGRTFVQQFQVSIPSFGADITVSTRLPGQEFPVSGNPIYEGTAGATGTMLGTTVSGDAWIEQAF